MPEVSPRTLQRAREDFITEMNRDTSGPERPRLLAVLDALIDWSKTRSKQVRFREVEKKAGVVSFEWTESRELIWAAQPTRGDAPKLALVPRAANVLTDDQIASARDTLNLHARDQIEAGDKLRIGFGALKNADARAAVLALLDQLVTVPKS